MTSNDTYQVKIRIPRFRHVTCRLNPSEAWLLERLKRERGESKSEIIRLALVKLGEEEGIELAQT